MTRREKILSELRRDGSVTVAALARLLGVSELTIRRDIGALADRGLLTRVHGGAILRSRLDTTVPAASDPALHLFRVGMVVPVLSYYWPQIIVGARAAASERGVRLLLRSASYDPADQSRQITALIDSGTVHGLIVAPHAYGADGAALLEWLDALPIPVVLVERRAPSTLALTRLEWVTTDHVFGGSLAAAHLSRLGHQRVGLIAAPGSPTSRQLRRGWSRTVEELGMTPTFDIDVSLDALAADKRDHAVEQQLEQIAATRTTGVLVHSDPQAVLLQQIACDHGWRIPSDLAIVAYDDDVAGSAEPPITALRPPKQDVGRLAVETMVARLMAGAERPTQRTYLLPQLHVRQSSSPSLAPLRDVDAV